MNWSARYANEELNIDDHVQHVVGPIEEEAPNGSPMTTHVWQLLKPLMGLHYIKTIVGNSEDNPGHYEGAALAGKVVDTPQGQGLGIDPEHSLSQRGALIMRSGRGVGDSYSDAHHASHLEVIKDAIRHLLENHRD